MHIFSLFQTILQKQRKEKDIWQTAFIRFLLEQKNNKDFSAYTYEELKNETKMDILLEESLDSSCSAILFIFLLILLLLFLFFLFQVPLFKYLATPSIIIFICFIIFLFVIHELLLNKFFSKEAIKQLTKYFNHYKISKTVLMFLLEKHLTDIQNNIFFLIDINKYKLNREKPKETKENEEPSTNKDNGNLNSTKSFFWKKDKEENNYNNYDYLKVVDYIQDYKEYLEHQEDKKDN